MASADCLVLLSDVDGLYTADPEPRPGRPASSARSAQHHARDRGDGRAARPPRRLGRHGHQDRSRRSIAVAAGCHMCIAAGAPPAPAAAASKRARACTWFLPSATPAAARKQWIAGTLRPTGALTIDAGRAAGAARGQEPAARRRHRRARALRARRYGERARRGRRSRSRAASSPIPTPMPRASWAASPPRSRALLGFRGRDEMIHRDDLVLHAPATKLPSRRRRRS